MIDGILAQVGPGDRGAHKHCKGRFAANMISSALANVSAAAEKYGRKDGGKEEH